MISINTLVRNKVYFGRKILFLITVSLLIQGCSFIWPTHIIVNRYPKEQEIREVGNDNTSQLSDVELPVEKIVNSETDWYTVGPEDVLEIKVWQNNDLSMEARVNDDGSINFPFLKKVKVLGKTATEISAMLTSMLAEGYVYEPQVFVNVKDYKSKKIYVIGEAEKNGTYNLKKPTTLFEFIAQMGGLKKTAGNRIIIKRVEKELSNEKMREIEIPVVDGEIQKNILLMENDVIDVPEAKYFIAGEVSKPGYYKIEEDYNIYQAIVVAGDFTKAADETRVKLSRDSGRNVLVINVEKLKKGLERGISATSEKFRNQIEELKIHDGDMIIVPKSIFYSE
ncbi:MAG: polysaccharide biosynthesis/export family protein [Candidatus Schekmanbacteria bacterium]|nr:polysaccharide biosynthesis/export family protein [Candidatus Schekmanbacteria bacterium]